MNQHMMKLVLSMALAAGLPSLESAQAVMYDLTAGGSATINGGVFQTGEIQPAGTGVIDSFVRIQMNGTEQGYNTDGRPVPFNEKTDPNFTRSLLLSEVPIKTLDGVAYREFLLDINEQASPTGRFLSLDQMKVFLSPNGSMTTTNLSLLGNLVYDLDAGANNWIKLNGNLFPPGSGTSDMFAYIPDSLFVGTNPYVTLYSQFGTNFASGAGFEEWAVRAGLALPPGGGGGGGEGGGGGGGGGGAGAPVPEPASLLLMASGLAGLAARSAKKKREA